MKTYVDKFITIGDCKVRYWESGEGHSQTIVLLHGFAMSVESWGENIAALAKHAHVLALDLPGFGKSQMELKKRELDFLPKFLLHFLVTLGLPQICLLGHSMGGKVALRFAQLFPEKLNSLILVSSAGFTYKLPFRLLTLPLLGEFLIRPNKKGIRSSLSKHMYARASLEEELVESLFQISYLPGYGRSLLSVLRNSADFIGMNRRMIQRIRRDLKKVTMPTLLIWGEQDQLSTLQEAHSAYKGIQNAKLVVFDHCGHFPQLEHPKKFTETVLSFI
ncbi:MAG: alpha/beta fold hydrolase [Silvanigrellaceae bacterium]|nr:alpha/beta fold hydrolase [Silvanigrellaceae bacterium]